MKQRVSSTARGMSSFAVVAPRSEVTFETSLSLAIFLLRLVLVMNETLRAGERHAGESAQSDSLAFCLLKQSIAIVPC